MYFSDFKALQINREFKMKKRKKSKNKITCDNLRRESADNKHANATGGEGGGGGGGGW